MKFNPALLVFILLFATIRPAISQEYGWTADRAKLIIPPSDSLFLDSLPVVQSSIRLENTKQQPLPLTFTLYVSPVSYIKFEAPVTDTLMINYQVLDLPLNKTFFHKDSSIILENFRESRDPLYRPQENSSSFKPFSGLNSSGSISRGISVGNNQDAVLNSSLNLQLSGDLGEGTQIRASITDNSIPVQADGYTQQLQEFDKVYIELENIDFGRIRAGDYNMQSQENYFLRFDKRISGAGIFSSIKTQGVQIPLEIQGGIARGKFARNRFQGDEGNQGPYKLTGNFGEAFIIIISGSERVYIDGVLMKRGEQYDYVIDYNAGEITFTALRPITREKRIVVEFQYTEQNYLRTVAFGNTGVQTKNFKTTVQYYNEQDSKNQPLLNEISDEEKRIMSKVGDNLQQAVVSTIRPSEFKDDAVLYRLTDSLGIDSILVVSTDSTLQLYSAAFTYLGPQRGNYRLIQSNANGRVFEWVPPINGQPQGLYDPVKQLIAPNRLQIISAHTEGKIGKEHSISADLASSKSDINLFSDLDEENDDGAAGKINYEWRKKLQTASVFTQLNYEFNQKEFVTIERIRNVEFGRDWNLGNNYNGSIQMGSAGLGIETDSARIFYQLSLLDARGFKGLKHGIEGQLTQRDNIGRIQASWLQTKDSLGSTEFLREQGYFTHYIIPGLWTGIRSQGEWNMRMANHTDTLRRKSYNFIEYQLYAGIGDTNESFLELNYLQRYDDTALQGRFENHARAISYGLRSQWKTGFNSLLGANVNIRNLEIIQPEVLPLEQTITSRINYTQRLWKNSIISNSFYETGSGTEPRRNYSYLEVPAGTGTYTHTDYNNNGLKELDEFEIAPSPDLARYVRVYSISTDYLRTSLIKLGENINIMAPTTWQSKGSLLKTVSRFSLLFNYQLDRKTLLSDYRNNINPFAPIEADSTIVSLNNNFRSTLFFNRTSARFGADYTYRKTDNRNLLSFGIERKTIAEHTINTRVQVIEVLLLKLKGSRIYKENISANFSKRNYAIDQLTNTYSLSYQPGSAFIFTTRYTWDNQFSKGENENKLFSQIVGIDMNYNAAEKLSALLSMNYIINDFEGQANSPAGYEMLQSLSPGKNGTWTLGLQRTLRDNILISLNYSGRVSPDNFPIHTGNLEIKAFF